MTEKSDEGALDTRVRNWVETAGFALELRVARAFHRLAGERPAKVGRVVVEPSRNYLDGDCWREIDVVSTVSSARNVKRRIQVVVECKSGAEKPWVVFTDPDRPSMDRERSFQHVRKRWSGSADIWGIWDNVRSTPCFPSTVSGYAIAEALVEQATAARRAQNGAEVPFRAVRQAMTAAICLNELLPDDEPDLTQFTIPIVVTGAPLFEVSLGHGGEVETSRVPYTALLAQPTGNNPPLVVQVMTETHLAEWIRCLGHVVDHF